jgi:colicin import membrane protein
MSLTCALFFSSGPKNTGVRKVPESKAVEEGPDPAITPKKRRAESPGATGHTEKKQKTHSAELSDMEAEKATKGSEFVASKEAKAADAKMKAAEGAKTKAAEAAKMKAAKEAVAAAMEKAAKKKAKAKKHAKVISAAGAPRHKAKDGQELVMT